MAKLKDTITTNNITLLLFFIATIFLSLSLTIYKIYIIGFLFILLVIYILYKFYGKYQGAKLPAKCRYNPFTKKIELHINSLDGGFRYNILAFNKYVAECILLARQLSLPVTFISAHRSQNQLYNLFGSAINIRHPRKLERIDSVTTKLFYRIHKVNNTGILLHAEIDTTCLNRHQITNLNKIANTALPNKNPKGKRKISIRDFYLGAIFFIGVIMIISIEIILITLTQ